MGTNRSWNRRPTVPVTVKKMLIRRPTVNCKRPGRADCAASECSLPPLFTSKNSCLLIVGGWVGARVSLWTGVPPHAPHPRTLQVSSFQNKASFPLLQPCLFIGLRAAGSQTPIFGQVFWQPVWGCCSLATSGCPRFLPSPSHHLQSSGHDGRRTGRAVRRPLLLTS